MEQLSLFNPLWIPEIDTGCRMWKCPGCGGRVIGKPMNVDKFWNKYKSCPYCGVVLDAVSKMDVLRADSLFIEDEDL